MGKEHIGKGEEESKPVTKTIDDHTILGGFVGMVREDELYTVITRQKKETEPKTDYDSCAFCQTEIDGYPSPWGLSPEGWQAMEEKHEREHVTEPETNEKCAIRLLETDEPIAIGTIILLGREI